MNESAVDKNSQGLKKLAYMVIPILEIVGPFMLKCFSLLYEVKFNIAIVISVGPTALLSFLYSGPGLNCNEDAHQYRIFVCPKKCLRKKYQ